MLNIRKFEITLVTRSFCSMPAYLQFAVMYLHMLSDEIWFPPVEEALPDGLLAMGGDLNVERLLLAYRSGIFPWYDDETPLWWSPDPRFVLFPEKLKISKSMKQLLKKDAFDFTTNKAFDDVIRNCRQVSRPGQE